MNAALAWLVVNLVLIGAAVVTAATATFIIPPIQAAMVDEPIVLVAVGAIVLAVAYGYLWGIYRGINRLLQWRHRRKSWSHRLTD